MFKNHPCIKCGKDTTNRKYCSRKCGGNYNNMRGKKFTKEHDLKVGLANKGKTRIVTEETREKMRQGWANKVFIPWNKGQTKNSNPILRRIAENKKGKKLPLEWKEKIRISGIGRISGMKGKKQTDHARRLMSISHTREKHPNWKGGKSYELYGREFDRELKIKIRLRDNHECKICHKYALDVHHIDYNKYNNMEDNLVVLCRSCHVKTNTNRDYWQEFFIHKISKINLEFNELIEIEAQTKLGGI